MGNDNRVRVVERAVELLWALAETPASLTTLSKLTDLSMPTAYRILSTLAYKGLVLKDQDSGVYRLGPGIIYLVARLGEAGGGFSLIGRDHLRHLVEQTGETATLHIRVGSVRVCVAEHPSPAALRYTAGVGTTAPLYVGSAGKVLLAFMSQEQREAVLDGLEMEPITPYTVTDPVELERQLVAIRDAGYATSSGERVVGASAISVPILYHNEVYAALSLLGPAARLPEDELAEYVPLLQRVAQQLMQVIEMTQARSYAG